MNRLLTLTFFSIITTYSFAQISVNRDTSVDVYESNTKYKSPWVGGMNSVQFNEIDLNLYGVNDLITFDRSGNKKALKLFEIILIFPVNCCVIE